MHATIPGAIEFFLRFFLLSFCFRPALFTPPLPWSPVWVFETLAPDLSCTVLAIYRVESIQVCTYLSCLLTWSGVASRAGHHFLRAHAHAMLISYPASGFALHAHVFSLSLVPRLPRNRPLANSASSSSPLSLLTPSLHPSCPPPPPLLLLFSSFPLTPFPVDPSPDR